VVKSSTGAVLQDIKNVTARRNSGLNIFVYDAQVQGNLAVKQVIEGISYFDNYSDVDVIIVARGGGSLEDLSAFNNEELARVAYICNKPLVSAVGHETDFSILDFVADLRAPTPSAAAELVTYDANELQMYIKNINYTIANKLEHKFLDLKNNLSIITSNIQHTIIDIINDQNLIVIDIYNKIKTVAEQNFQQKSSSLDKLITKLDVINPTRILKLGYSYVENKNLPINNNANVGDEVNIITDSVKYKAQITKKEKLDARTKY